MSRNGRTLIEVLIERAAESGSGSAFTFLNHRRAAAETETLTFAELDARARRIGAHLALRRTPGEPILLLFPPGLDYVAAFFGALYGGMVPVPAYPPHPARLARMLPRLVALLDDSGARAILCTSAIAAMSGAAAEAAPRFGECDWISVDELPVGLEDTWSRPDIGADDLCFLQYTSGSTSSPKGVMVTHANLVANQAMIAEGMGNDASIVGVSWLPMYHDMGLIGHIIQPLYLGIHSVLMSPLAFLARPIRWLRAISDFGGTTSGGPNFAYDLCVRKVTDEQVAELDLSSWRTAYSGAEPVRESTLRAFHQKFEPAGLSWDALFPCYGLAEATLFVSGGPPRSGPSSLLLDALALEANRIEPVEEGRSLVRCGTLPKGEEVVIADPESRRRAEDGHVGEIWVRGAHVARGYWRDPEKTEETFGARLDTGEGPFLRTGDLGFLQDGQLVVTGRLKDLIIVGGRNHYPQDIELTVERAHPSVRPGCSVAFTVEVAEEERLVAVLEVERRYRPDRRISEFPPATGSTRSGADRRQENLSPANQPDGPVRWDADEVMDLVREAIWREHGVSVHSVVLLRPGLIPRTSSGKVRRRATRDSYLGERFEAVAQRTRGAEREERDHRHPETAAEKQLASIWRDVLAVNRVGRDDSFVGLGGDSVKAAQVVWRAREAGLQLSLQSMFEHPTLEALAAASTERRTPTPSAPRGGQEDVVRRALPAASTLLDAGEAPSNHALIRATDVEPARLEEALLAVLRHHRELRRSVRRSAVGWVATETRPEAALRFRTGELPALSPEEEDRVLDERVLRLAEDLDRGAGARLAVEQLMLPGTGGTRASRIVLVADPAAIDAISWWALLDDLDRAYRRLEAGEELRLAEHHDASLWANEVWNRAAHPPSAPMRLWLEQLDLPGTIFETSGEAPRGDDWYTHRIRIPGLAESLRALAEARHARVLEVAATAALLTARAHAGGACVRIGVHTAGRSDGGGGDVSRTVGRFAAAEPLGVDLADSSGSLPALALVSRHIARLNELGLPFAAVASVHADDHIRGRIAAAEPAQLCLRYGDASSSRSALPRLGYAYVSPDRTLSRGSVDLSLIADEGEVELLTSAPAGVFIEQQLESFAHGCVDELKKLVRLRQEAAPPQHLARVSLGEGELEAALARAALARKK